MPPITNDWADYLKEEYKSHIIGNYTKSYG